MATASGKPRHPLFVELGLASPGLTNANGKRSRQKQQQPQQQTRSRPIGALDVLQHLLETNVVTTDQLRAAHIALTDARAESKAKKEEETKRETMPDCRTRHIALRVYYEGKNYSGLAENVGQDSDQSVEKHVFAALRKTRLIQSRDTCTYSRCGRTDKGVSAVGQVVAMRLRSAIPLEATWDEAGQELVAPTEEAKIPKNSNDTITVWVPPKDKKKKKKSKKNSNSNPLSNETETTFEGDRPSRQRKEISEYAYEKMINSLLPPDIRVLGWCPVSSDFSARFSCSDRVYRYFFIRRNLNLAAMKEGLQLLVGKHDFRNLCKLNVVEVSNFVRTIHAAELISGVHLFGSPFGGANPTTAAAAPESSDLCYFQIQGQAFLWHQIRCIVSVLFLIGKDLELPSVITDLLNVEKNPGKPSYPFAEEFPLVLHGCGYPNLQIRYSLQNMWTVTCKLEGQWEKLVLEAARVRNCLDTLKFQTVRRKELIWFGKNRLTERLKKEQRNHQRKNNNEQADRWTASLESIESEEEQFIAAESSPELTWGDAMAWLGHHDMVPDSNGLVDHVHIPLLQRSRGTTLEEKLEALQQASTKRSQRYEENVAKKQKSEGEDKAFYEHMLKQGNS